MRTAIVTGAASGIGRATAVHFANEDWRVAALDIDHDGLASLP
ncbi:MAG: SDR family NAD(P)-dependent oxidoreductase, partial [Alphaproteobacteria bacterium]|nr:SDR family NAD(P)-dependent oxidoreductase [Alphaproteobacteria bacterium]